MANHRAAACAAIPSPLHPRPVNKAAALVAFFPGENWTATKPVQAGAALDAPPIPRAKKSIEKYEHVTGMRRGKLVAVSFYAVNKNHKTIWLMRCDCGRYAFRFIKGWAKREGVFDQCGECSTVAAISNTNRSRATHGIRRAKWMSTMASAGFTIQQCEFVRLYGLPTDDLDWLKGALAEIEAINAQQGGRHE